MLGSCCDLGGNKGLGFFGGGDLEIVTSRHIFAKWKVSNETAILLLLICLR